MNKQRNQSMTRWKWVSAFFAFIGLLFAVSQPESVDAAPARNGPKTTVISQDPTYTLDSKYSFIPEYGPNTSLQVSSNDFKDMTYSRSSDGTDISFGTKSLDVGANNWRTIDRRMRNGNYRARYTNVGRVNGQSVDLRITIKGWDRYGRPGDQYRLVGYAPLGNVSFRKDDIGFVSQGLNYTDLEWTVVRSGTNSPVSVSGYYTFNDIDQMQYVGFSNNSWDNSIDQVLLQNNNNRLNYKHRGGYHQFTYDTMRDISDDNYDSRHAITVLYSNESTLNIRWGLDNNIWERLDARQSPTRLYHPYVRNSIGALMMYTAKKPAPTDMSAPEKVQSRNTLIHDQQVEYDVIQKVPYEHSDYWFDSFEIRDDVDSVYDIKGANVYDENDNVVTNQFNLTINRDNNLVRARAKKTKRQSFYDSEYRLRIDAVLNGERARQKMGSDNGYEIENVGEVITDGDRQPTPPTTITVDRQQITVRHVDEHGNDIIDPQVTNTVAGLPYDSSPRTDLYNDRGHQYRHINTTGTPSGTVTGDHTVIYHYDEPREITMEHRTLQGRDKDILLGTSTEWEYDGNKITMSSNAETYRDDEGYFYRPRENSKEITVNGPSTMVMRYDTPRTVTIHHRDKDDNRLLRETFIKGIYDGETYTAKPLVETLLDVDNYYYRPVETHNRVGIVDGNMPLEDYESGDRVNPNIDENPVTILYERPRIIEILHKDNDNGDLIQTDIHNERIYDGDGYTIYSRANEELSYYHEETDTTYFYYPLDPHDGGDRARATGTVVEAEVDKSRNTFTIEFFYTKPSLDLGLSYIRIDTDRIESGLPVQLEFDHEIIVEDRWNENDVTLTVYDRDSNVEVYQDTNVDVNEIQDGLSITADASHLESGDDAIYEAVLSTNDKQSLVTDYATQSSIDTNAYAASEAVIEGESVDGQRTSFNYEGVAMTERRLGEDIREYHERMTATLDPSRNMISGYGYELAQDVTFETEVDDHSIPEIELSAHAHPNIADGEDYEVVDGNHVFELESTVSDGDLSREARFEMPETFVSRREGNIYLNDADDRVSGGRKAYVPIWINQLGEYDYSVKSNRLGRNYVQFDLDQKVTVDAYMFGHIDSETLDDDALLIEPAKRNALDEWLDR